MTGPIDNRFQVELRFYGDLPIFVARAAERVTKTLREKTSVKDAIESCGVPHSEVDGLLVNGAEADFGFQLEAATDVHVYGVPAPEFIAKLLQRRRITRFVADGHLGKLVRRMRVLGLDVLYERNPHDAQLVETAREQDRALLTRDRRLLMHAAVRDGYWLRSQSADEQAVEVVRRFELRDTLRPFTRCATCNADLESVTKEEVLDQLEPLTRTHYHEFRRCTGCGQVYWAGSHAPKLQAQLAQLGLANCRCQPDAER